MTGGDQIPATYVALHHLVATFTEQKQAADINFNSIFY